MLTADYRRLGLQPGDRVLDLGCGGGRHAFEVIKRSAFVVALDLDEVELKNVRAVFGAMSEAGEVPAGGDGGAVCGSALSLPFPDASFDRVIASEVFEHIDDDGQAARELARVLRPGGTLAVTVPRFAPEVVCWLLSDDYHAPNQPGGHVRIYRERTLRSRLGAAGLVAYDRHHAHGLHSAYWWLRCAVGVRNADRNRIVREYHSLLVREMTDPTLTLRLAERVLQPVIGKSLVVYVRRNQESAPKP